MSLSQINNIISTAAQTVYDLAFQVSPIILNGGIANGVLGNAMPIIQLTGQLLSLVQGLASSQTLSVSDFYAQYVVLPGGTVINNSVANYTFANQQTAANALIQNPNNVSLQMIAPVKDTGGYFTKLALFTSLHQSLQQHNQNGGWYTIATPARIYGPCLMTGMTDITTGVGNQKQIIWQIDFTEPLITLAQAQAAQNSLMSKVTNGQQISGIPTWSGAAAGIGTAMQGALAGTTGASGIFGAINQFLTSAPTL